VFLMPVVYGCPRTGVFRCAKYSFFGKPQAVNRRTRSTLPKKAVQSPATSALVCACLQSLRLFLWRLPQKNPPPFAQGRPGTVQSPATTRLTVSLNIKKCRCNRIGTFHYPIFFLQVKITLPDRVTSTVSPCFSNSISSWSAALALYRFPSASAR